MDPAWPITLCTKQLLKLLGLFFLHKCNLITNSKVLVWILGSCLLQHDSSHGFFLSLNWELFNKLEGKRAETEQVPLPATPLIAWALLQISNQTNISITGTQMRWWNVPVHLNVQIWTTSDSWRLYAPFSHWLTLLAKSKIFFCFKNEMKFRRRVKASKTSLDSLKVSVPWVCSCVIQLSDSLHVSEG